MLLHYKRIRTEGKLLAGEASTPGSMRLME